MIKQKHSWGIILFSISILFAGLCYYIITAFPPKSFTAFYEKTIPVIGAILSILSFFIGHFSYPRVHNLKVYLAGYLTGITGCAFFLLYKNQESYELAIRGLALLNFANILVFLLLPSYVKYRITRRITLSFVAFEIVILSLFRWYPGSIRWAELLFVSKLLTLPVIFGALWFVLIVSLSIVRLKRSFFLGGLFSGCALLYLFMWTLPLVFPNPTVIHGQRVLFVFVTLYLEIGIFAHWLYRMEHRISYDPLLHIYNRNYCSKIIEEQSNVKTAPPFGVAMVDIDHFKKVNDSYGHQAGDKVLYQVAQTILREVIPDGIACRYGGEEIIIFFPQKRAKQLVGIMENVRKSIASTKIPTKRKKLSVTVSCGVAHRELIGQTIMDVIHTADKALYRAKNNGRNQVRSGKTSTRSLKKK